MKTKRRPIEVFNLSFLDIVSCGFGAIILLLILSKVSQPLIIEQIKSDLSGVISRQEKNLSIIRNKTKNVNQQLSYRNKELSELNNQLQQHQQQVEVLQGQYQNLSTDISAQNKIIKQLQSAQQSLTDEMRRLNQLQPVNISDSIIGGIPADSEYIIFVIDTSGSMQRFAWPMVRKKMREILEIYPHVKGIQVMNDMGDYMFSQYAGRWIPDSPARRRSILTHLQSWAPFSNSSPVEGITHAIKKFHRQDKSISIYIFGDDFSKGSIQEVIETIDKLNSTTNNKRRVRIHAVGFPVLLLHSSDMNNVARFSALMRILAEHNNGSFVGLNSLH